MPALPRIQGSQREAAGAAELAGAELAAAAGVRLKRVRGCSARASQRSG